jgi:DnaK suppressor protein
METYHRSMADRFSQLLTEREAQLCSILRAADAHAGMQGEAGSHEVVDFKDMADQENLASLDEAKAEQASHELEQVLAAQRRLQEGRYGLCLDCEEPIDLRRLEALPATPFCTACQTVRERAHPDAATH